MKKIFSALFVFLVALLVMVPKEFYGQQPWKSKLNPGLMTKMKRDSIIDFIVVMNDQADLNAARNIHGKEAKGNFVYQTLSSHAENSQREIILQLQRENISCQSFWVTNALLVKGSASLIERLAERNDVKKILYNSAMGFTQPVAEQDDYLRGITIPWGVDSIYAPAVWQMGIKGAGVVVGGQDTGYDWEHPALKNQYRGWNGVAVDNNYNWHDAIHAPDPHNVYPNPCGIDLKSPCDDFGHGTHTMGTMVGLDGSMEIGIAPEAKWIGERNMEQGWGNLASYMEAFQWFIAPTDTNNLNPDPSKAPHVINDSWVCVAEEGCDTSNFSLLEDVVNSTKAAGIVVVASAGNNGPYCNTIFYPPAMYEASFTVGAIDSTMNIASFSSRGNVLANGSGIQKPNVTAPGVDVLSSIPGDQYAFYSGTSMAGPHTVGTVALVICANPLLAGEVDQIENIIEETAHPVFTNEGCGADDGSTIPNNTYGYGIIDALSAVQLALTSTSVDIVSGGKDIHVFPSVTSDELFVNFDGAVSGGSLKIFSLAGQLLGVMQLNAAKNIVHLSSLPSDMYLIRADTGGKSISGKFVKQ